jgi:hypothetical protein
MGLDSFFGNSKDLYLPSHKRFDVSDDPISRERIRALKDAYGEMETLLPGIRVAFSLFGSLSKGKPLRPRSLLRLDLGNEYISDIDLICYFDADDLAQQHAQLMTNCPGYAEPYKRVIPDPDRYEENWAQQAARNLLQGAVPRLVQSYIGKSVPIQLLKVNPIRTKGEFSIRNTVERCWMPYDDVHPEYSSTPEDVARFFHLDVGGGLKRYRQEFLRELSELPVEEAEKYWGTVDRCVRQTERSFSGGAVPEEAERQFPATFKDALTYYGLPKQENL